MKSKKTWVLVADGGRARVLEQSGDKERLTLVEGMDFEHPIPKSSDLGRDRLPRTFDSVGPGRHAITPKSDPHRAEKKDFAKELADLLDASLAKHAYDHLIVVAPPQMIGDLRPALSEAVRSRVKQELLLDLADAPILEIARRLKDARAA
jgi:protein required for attachment to host cells